MTKFLESLKGYRTIIVNAIFAFVGVLIDNYSDKPGISKTTLEAKFADARRRLHST